MKRYDNMLKFAVSESEFGIVGTTVCKKVPCTKSIYLICGHSSYYRKEITSKESNAILAIVNYATKRYIPISVFASVSDAEAQSVGWTAIHENQCNKEMILALFSSSYFIPRDKSKLFFEKSFVNRIEKVDALVDRRLFQIPQESYSPEYLQKHKDALVKTAIEVTDGNVLNWIFGAGSIILYLSDPEQFCQLMAGNPSVACFFGATYWMTLETVKALANIEIIDSFPNKIANFNPRAKCITIFFKRANGSSSFINVSGAELVSALLYPGFCAATAPCHYKFNENTGEYEPFFGPIRGIENPKIGGIYPRYIADIAAGTFDRQGLQITHTFVPWSKVTLIKQNKKTLFCS